MSDLIEKFLERGTRLAESEQNFVDQNFLEGLDSLSENEINRQDFGIIKLDDSGKILIYNQYESSLAGVAIKDAKGKNFFYEIAPCTNNRLFLGSFKTGVESKSIKMLFFYTFTYRMKPTNVKVLFFRKIDSASNWVLIKKNTI